MSRSLPAVCFLALLGLTLLAPVQADDKERAFDDIGFVQLAATGNLMELKLGKSAKEQATNDDVRRFAERMIKDHTAAHEALKRVATAMDITLPTTLPKEKQEASAHLEKLRGADFDKEYMDHMVKNHEKSVEKYSRATKEAKNERIRGFAEKTLPTIKEHLEEARRIKTKLSGGSR